MDFTDSDSKQFFDEVFDDAKDFDNMLLDMPLIAEETHHHEDPNDENFEFEMKREIQTMKHGQLKSLLKGDPRINHSDDEEGLCDVGDETYNGDHSSVPKPSMKTRTIRDINSKNDNNRILSPIRENEGLNDSHEYESKNYINVSEDGKYLAKSYQNEKDWKKLDEVELIESRVRDKNFGKQLKSRNNHKISAKTFKMKSHILLPPKVTCVKNEEAARVSMAKKESEEQKISNDTGDQSPVFEVCKQNKETKETVVEFSQAIEDFSKGLIDHDNLSNNSSKDVRDPILGNTDNESFFGRRKTRQNMNSLIEKDENLLESSYMDCVHSNYSIGDDIRTSNISETTKNINNSFDDDISNRHEEIEASIESLELKASLLVNNDDQVLEQCQQKVKEYFDKCMDGETANDDEVKNYIFN